MGGWRWSCWTATSMMLQNSSLIPPTRGIIRQQWSVIHLNSTERGGRLGWRDRFPSSVGVLSRSYRWLLEDTPESRPRARSIRILNGGGEKAWNVCIAMWSSAYKLAAIWIKMRKVFPSWQYRFHFSRFCSAVRRPSRTTLLFLLDIFFITSNGKSILVW